MNVPLANISFMTNPMNLIASQIRRQKEHQAANKTWMTNPHPAASLEVNFISMILSVCDPRPRMGMASL